ncbi:MAG: SLATT domain-containing protein [Desulfobacterales bacterium]|nr:MAG: SLATT domain-containing protein [Desulfobacterales bacterium]
MKRTFQEVAANYFRYSILKCNANYDIAEMYKVRHRRFGVWVVGITILVGTSVFAALAGMESPTAQALTAFLSVAAVILAALQTFLGFSDLQSQHKTAAAGYGDVRRDIELLVMKFPEATGAENELGTDEIASIKKHLDDLDMTSPTIPDKVWDAIVKKSSLTE